MLVPVLSILPVIWIGIDRQTSNEISYYSKQEEGFKMAGIDEGARSNKVAGLTAPAPITANAGAKLSFDQPRISTTSGATGIATPYAGGNPTPITAPSYVSGGSPARFGSAPAPAMPAQQAAQAAAPPMPPQGGAQWYQGLDAGGRAAQDQSWLGGDSDYTSQIAEYDRSLQTFIDRIMNQKKMFNQDANDAVASTDKNQTMSLDQLGEDFGARGLSYSGMFDTTKNQTNDRFNEAKGNIEKVRGRNLTDADNREADYRTENGISRGNAERSSLSRQAQRQALLDSAAGF
jgi:hypothetical protein